VEEGECEDKCEDAEAEVLLGLSRAAEELVVEAHHASSRLMRDVMRHENL
jgi:hypothetical protein